MNPLFIFRITAALSAFCGIVLLFLPVVWMEIGPEGIAYYGPQVPDIYIYGGAITGKDLAFTPILIAMLLQFALIMIGIFLSTVNCFGSWSSARTVAFVWLQTLLLLLFPLWMKMYVGGVICNSDGAAHDLTVHTGAGSFLYLVLCAVNVSQLLLIHVGMRKKKPRLLPA